MTTEALTTRKTCACGMPAFVKSLVVFHSGALETHYHCGAHARTFRYAAVRLGYTVTGEAS